MHYAIHIPAENSVLDQMNGDELKASVIHLISDSDGSVGMTIEILGTWVGGFCLTKEQVKGLRNLLKVSIKD